MIPPGITSRARASHADDRERIVLFVGSLFNRRRLPDLIAAFARATIDLPDARLVIVGDDRTYPQQNLEAVATEHGVRARVELKRYVPDGELADLYARASVFAFLSEYEGFGMTPLEALSAGTPSVVLNSAVAREVYGEAAIFVEPGDIAATAGHLRRLLTDRAEARPILNRAAEILARYSWDAAADCTLTQLERIARQ
jgi:glycosyltransferase involved in cell wall biosynthesis